METTVEKKEVVIQLNSELTAIEIKPTDLAYFNESIRTKTQKTVRDCIESDLRHRNYMDYLKKAWSNHYGILMSPDIFWFMLLNECATHIKNNSEHYRSLFTNSSEGKVDIIVPTADPELIDLDLISRELKNLVPTDIDAFLPEFSTSTKNSSLAFRAAFADAMSPYYDYSMYLCGIPKVKILGSLEDWSKVNVGIDKLQTLLNKDEKISSYFDAVKNISKNITVNLTSPDAAFWDTIFSLKRCGSGGQVEVSGWITDLYFEKPRVKYTHNYSSHIAKVPYKFLNTGQNFELCYGLFSSKIEDGFLVPDFGFIINEEVK